MALMKSGEKSSLPKDAVILDEMEARTYVWNLVTEWTTKSDTWALEYGPVILGGINAFSGILINQHYRKKVKLGNYGFFASVIPITFMPGILTMLFHRHLVSTDMLLMKKDTCPMCFEVRSAFIQWGLGLVYPMVLGPTAAFMIAQRYSTYRIPSLLEPKLMYEFMKKVTRPFTGTMMTLFVTQFVASSFITYFEMKNNFAIKSKLLEMEKTMESRGFL